MIVCTVQSKYRYSGLSTDVKPLDSPDAHVQEGSTFWEIDTGHNYEYRGDDWVRVQQVVVLEEGYAVVVYESGSYIYICRAQAGTAITAPRWQVKRVNTQNIAVAWAHGNANFSNLASSLSVVAALPFS